MNGKKENEEASAAANANPDGATSEPELQKLI